MRDLFLGIVLLTAGLSCCAIGYELGRRGGPAAAPACRPCPCCRCPECDCGPRRPRVTEKVEPARE